MLSGEWSQISLFKTSLDILHIATHHCSNLLLPAPKIGANHSTEVTIGGQSLMLDFDTGSSDLWVFSSSLSSTDKSGHEVFTASDSSTYKKLSGYSWNIQYADGSGASGTVGTDTVKIGGTTVTGQAVELATKVSSTFVSDTADGLVGLAFSSINTVEPEQQLTFFDNAQADLDSPLFTAWLPSESDGKYTFGYIDDSKYTGTIVYTDVDDSNGFWEYSSTSYKVGSTVHSQSGRTGISGEYPCHFLTLIPETNYNTKIPEPPSS